MWVGDQKTGASFCHKFAPWSLVLPVLLFFKWENFVSTLRPLLEEDHVTGRQESKGKFF